MALPCKIAERSWLDWSCEDCPHYEEPSCPGCTTTWRRHDGFWFSFDPRYDTYDPDWYPPVSAPHSQHMWANYMEWAAYNFDYVTQRCIYLLQHGRTDRATLEGYEPWHAR